MNPDLVDRFTSTVVIIVVVQFAFLLFLAAITKLYSHVKGTDFKHPLEEIPKKLPKAGQRAYWIICSLLFSPVIGVILMSFLGIPVLVGLLLQDILLTTVQAPIIFLILAGIGIVLAVVGTMVVFRRFARSQEGDKYGSRGHVLWSAALVMVIILSCSLLVLPIRHFTGKTQVLFPFEPAKELQVEVNCTPIKYQVGDSGELNIFMSNGSQKKLELVEVLLEPSLLEGFVLDYSAFPENVELEGNKKRIWFTSSAPGPGQSITYTLPLIATEPGNYASAVTLEAYNSILGIIRVDRFRSIRDLKVVVVP